MLIEILFILIILFSAIILHEYAHGWSAYKFGDPTAKLAGRLTLNPIKHIDPIGTLILPGILLTLRFMGVETFVFGWAKPVPVDFRRLRNPKQNMIWVALAGPAVNIILAIIFSQVLRLSLSPQASQMIALAVFINLLLAVFNMIPIPPLDGSRLVMGLLPNQLARPYAGLEKYGILIVVALLYLGLFEIAVFPVIVLLGSLLGVSFS